MKAKTSLLGMGLLLLAALLWGFGFTTQDLALAAIGPYTLGSIRNLLATLFLIPVIMFFDRKTERRLFSLKNGRPHIDIKRVELIGGISCGIALTVAATLQAIGIAGETDTGTAAFITSLYMIFVPLIGLFRGKLPSARVWCCVLGALVGFYFLSANIVFTESGIGGFFSGLFSGGLRFAASDIIVLIGAVVFAIHIIVIDKFSPDSDGIRLSAIQTLTSGILLFPIMLIVDRPSMAEILSVTLPILYLAIFSSGIAYTAQIVGQKHVDVTIASIILSMESVFGALFGILFLNETKNAIQTVGCLLVFAAVVVAQLPAREKKKKGEDKSEDSENAN